MSASNNNGLAPILPGQPRNLEQEVADNMGGLEALFYTFVENIDWPNMPVADLNEAIVGDIPMVDGAPWYMMTGVLHTFSWEETEMVSASGSTYRQSVKGLFAKQTPGLMAGLASLRGRRIICMCQDRNGYFHLVGTQEQYLGRQIKRDTQSSVPGRNQVDIALATETVRPAPFYFGEFTVAVQGLIDTTPYQAGTPSAGGDPVTITDTLGNVLLTAEPGQTVVVSSSFSRSFNIL
jgi:hypothetical protein